MSAVLILCGLSVAPCVTVADPADSPKASLQANGATRPKSNLPALVHDDHPAHLRNTDTKAAWWWPFRPTASVPRHEPPPAPTPEQADAIAVLQLHLDAGRARSGAPALHQRPSPASQQQTP